ncbi:unnamed protein product, partial [marine sediment metagenome]
YIGNIITPECIPKDLYIKLYADPKKIIRYNGLDEIAWISEYTPNPEILKNINVEKGKYVIIRTEPTHASYLIHKIKPEETQIKKEKLLLFLTSFLLFIVMVSYIANDSEVHYTDYNNINESIEVSTSLEGIENIIITKVNREVNISGYGLIYFEDLLEVKNLNNNPISSIFIGIPVNISDDLVLFEATGINQNTLFAKRSNLIMN